MVIPTRERSGETLAGAAVQMEVREVVREAVHVEVREGVWEANPTRERAGELLC